ncbi:WD40 repeat domain-containing serine/threonine protein kinase [Nocardia sp. CA-084685]|uniref:WD40 repeat domain-containing serine/threonine protein kinase n=1 Tax=Nocardia sp. CA-084685 TaxID=3239970 RepID=UPI003D96CD7F
MVLAAGDVFAGFVIEQVLGAGGMGVVYAARHPRMDRLVALKVLNDALAADPRARAAFDREAALAARLDHPNIVTVHDRSAPGDPVLWLAMRHIRGGDAGMLLTGASGGLAPELVVELIADAAAALDYAHIQGVLHRDVKPANLLIEADFRHGQRALLTDFGIARSLDSTVTLSSIAASFAYAAPERFTRAAADHRADIYSLGCTLYHLLTGQPPFPRDDQAAVIGAHLSEPPPAPTRIRPDLPVGLDTVIAAALAKNPENRYRTCTALAQASRHALTPTTARTIHGTTPLAPTPEPPQSTASFHERRLAETVVKAPPPPEPPQSAASSLERRLAETVVKAPPPPAASPDRRIGRRQLLIGTVIAVPVTAAAAGIIIRRSSSDEYPTVLTVLTVLTGHTGPVLSVAFSPDGTLLATGSWDTTVRIWDTRTHQPVEQPLTDHDDQVYSVAFSPDGTLLATGSWDTTVRIWDTRTHQPVGQPLTGHTGRVNSVAFSPDGALLATGSWDTTARIWDTHTHQPVGQPLTGHTDPVSSVAFSSDGTLLATGSWDTTARIWDTRTHQPVGQPLTGHTDRVNSVAFSPDGTLLATASDDKAVRVWDTRTHQPVGQPLTGHTHWVYSVAFSSDGALLATGSRDTTVRVWNTRTHQPVGQLLTGHTDPVNSVAFSPDGTLLATGSQDKTARLWKVTKP